MSALPVAAALLLLAVTPMDMAWTRWLAQHKVAAFAEFMAQSMFELEWPGGGDLVVCFLIAVVACYYCAVKARPGTTWARRRPAVGFIVTAGVVTAVYNVHSIKWILGRARPDAVFHGQLPFTPWFVPGPQLMSHGVFHGSFPSGHTALAFTPFALAFVLSDRRPAAAAAMGAAAALYAAAMGMARCMTTSHWITDVAGAVFLSVTAMVYLYYRLMRVPEQTHRCQAAAPPPDLPAGWELVLALTLGMVYAGAMALICGLRIGWQEGWSAWVLLVPAGAALAAAGIRLTGRLRRTVDRWLDEPPTGAAP